jgi:hypothetical protein
MDENLDLEQKKQWTPILSIASNKKGKRPYLGSPFLEVQC